MGEKLIFFYYCATQKDHLNARIAITNGIKMYIMHKKVMYFL